MIRYDAGQAHIDVFTEREGVLGAAGHDLHLRADELELVLDEANAKVEARVPAASVRLVAARRGERDLPEALGPNDRSTIERNLRDDVLHAARFPDIRFRSHRLAREGDGLRVEGTLALHGVERPLSFTARRVDGHYEAEFPLDQPSFGIKPYSALFGTLKVRPRVLVRVRVPAA